MKIVIDIPDGIYEIVQSTDRMSNSDYLGIVTNAIADGTPYEERKTGKWIVQPSPFYEDTTIYICPFCKSQYERNGWAVPKFCQNCGMKSIGTDETHKYAGWGKIYEDYPNES